MAEEDQRFASVSSDPRFKPIPKQERKVKIDRRFEAMFKDKKFKLKYTIDKRGRPLQQTTDESLRKFYEMSDSDSGSSDDESEKKGSKNCKVIGNGLKSRKVGDRHGVEQGNRNSEDGQSGLKGGVELNEVASREKRRPRRSGREEMKLLIMKRRQKLQRQKGAGKGLPLSETRVECRRDERLDDDAEEEEPISGGNVDKIKEESSEDPPSSSDDSLSSDDSSDAGDHNRIDYSRGGNFMESSSSSDESDSETGELEHVDIEHGWGELDKDAQRSEETSSRLALCNMDWDRVSAQDILVILSSFKPSGGVIKSVKIYISDLGFERMKDEEIHGPKELVEKDEKYEKLASFAEKKYFREKLRMYQFQRLKYYYAVIECDSVQTASHIYDQCDNYEFESSAVKLDLRFIPDDMTFDREPKEIAVSDSLDLDLYKPSEFVNSALQQSKVDLTWDEDNPERVKNTRTAFTKEELEKTDLNAYLASSSGEEDQNKEDQGSDEEDGLTEKERLEKYRSLVMDLDKEDEDSDAEMEITWEPGLKETTEELVSQKVDKEEADAKDGKTPWQQYLERKKEKKKEKKEKNKLENDDELGGSVGEEAFSDDELPAGVDLDDPFFSKKEDTKGSKKKKMKRRKDREDEPEEEDAEQLKKKAELELLMMDDDDNKQHFNLKEIMERENPKKHKRKKQKTISSTKDDDTFQVDVKDSRFNAIYTSHHFAIDPSDPQFKRTKAMEAIMEEKQTRRARGDAKVKRSQEGASKETRGVQGAVSKTAEGTGMGNNSDVSALIKSIKRNTVISKIRKR